MFFDKILKRSLLSLCLCLGLGVGKVCAQVTDGITGLLHMPNAEMQRDGTVMMGGNYLNWRKVPFVRSNHIYNTYNYYVNITFLKRLEVAYICTLNQGVPNSSYWPEETWGKYRNQDRHFAAKFLLTEEGQWWKHMPAMAVGVSDPTTGQDDGDYLNMGVDGSGNGYFNRWYVAATKHFHLPYGELGAHVAYLYNKRTDYHLNGPAFGVNFRPAIHRNLNLIVEYDAKTVNVGATYALWADHFNLMVELQEGKYLSAGLVYKVNLLGNNRWKAKVFDY